MLLSDDCRTIQVLFKEFLNEAVAVTSFFGLVLGEQRGSTDCQTLNTYFGHICEGLKSVWHSLIESVNRCNLWCYTWPILDI